MRTTLTLDPDVAIRLKKKMAEGKLTLKEAVNQTLRDGFAASPPKKRAPFKVKPFDLKFKPGVDPTKLNRLLDELEVEEFLRKFAR